MTDRATEQGIPPELALLHRLLDACGVSVDEKRLATAMNEYSSAQSKPIAQWLREVLVAAAVKDVEPVTLPGRRFDPGRLPALVRLNDTWYLAETADPTGVTLVDAEGNTSVVPTGQLDNALVLWLRRASQTSDADDRSLQGNLAARLVWQELFRDRGWLWQIAIATGLVNLLGVSTSLYAMQVYDRVVPTLAYTTLTALVAGMALVVLLDWVLKTVRARILDSLACAVDQRVSQRVYEHLMHVQLDQQPRSLGTLAAQVGSLDAVRQFFSSTVVFALLDLPFALLFLAFIAIIGGAVAWVYVLLLPAALLLGMVSQRRLRALFYGQLSRANERQGLLVDSIRGAETIRASNARWRFAEEWRSVTDAINRYVIQQRSIASLAAITTTSLSIIAYVCAVVVGVWQIEAGLLTMGGLIACSILGGRVIAPVAQGVQYLAQWQHVRQALNLVNALLSLPGERSASEALLAPTTTTPSLSLDRVRFAYPESPVRQLDIESLTLAPGDRVLVAGPVGSGKSTLLKILAGLYRPTEGRVLLGDADLWNVDPLVVSSHIGYLPQTVHLFRGTLASNLRLSGTASDDRLLDVAARLGVDAIAAAHPLGMNAPISEGGDGLSGGQRQLVGLARVFLDEPRIWLLDEPTASLDREMEQRVWQALDATLGPEDILLVSTHRPFLASGFFNRVLIVQQGRITRDGPPAAVLPQLGRPNAVQNTRPGGHADAI